jgi:hypothetical protein
MAKYTKEQINSILNLEGWHKTQIDVFNLYAVLTIGAALPITLEDFADCTSKAAVKKQFKKIMAKAVSAAMFPGDKVFWPVSIGIAA